MALGFINLGFETAGSITGHMAGWTVALVSASFQFAAYGELLETTAFETFDHEWGSNEDGIFEFDLDNDVIYALYDAVPTEYEDFESAWAAGNQVHYFSLPAVILAAYDAGSPEDMEDFEEQWSSNEDDLTEFAPGDTALAAFDPGSPEDYEDFEEEWGDNEDDIQDFAPGDLSLASFDGGGTGTPEDVEDFEEVDLCLHRINITATGVDPDEFHIVINGADVVYQATGVGTTADIRDIIVTYINAQLVGIAVAAADGGSKLTLRSYTNGANLAVSISTTGSAKMVLSLPDRTANWTQLGEL